MRAVVYLRDGDALLAPWTRPLGRGGEPLGRVRVQRPGTDGKYAFVDLPPGGYVLAAVTDMEPDAWRDPDFLRSLVGGGVQVRIGEGEQKTQDLKTGRAATPRPR